MRRLALWAAALALPVGLGAQGAVPLRKTDLIRLLSNALIQHGEVADLIRRNCLAFRPTERDWADLRTLGADADVLGSVGGCATRTSAPGAAAPTPAPPRLPSPSPSAIAPAPARGPATAMLEAVPLTPRVAALAGTDALIRVAARRGDTPDRGMTLMLRGAVGSAGGAARSVQAITDDSGFALFRVPGGPQAQRYRMELMTGGGAPLPGRPIITLTVLSAAPASADVHPAQLDLTADAGPFAVQVAVRDSFGNAVVDEPVELAPETLDIGIAPDTLSTDSLGRATFAIRPRAVRRSGRIAFRVRGQVLGVVDALLAGPVAGETSGFVAGRGQRGMAGVGVPGPLVFQARGASGRPLPGRLVVFHAQNARIAADSVVTDSAGRAQVDVTLGTRAGTAVVTASVEAVQRSETLVVHAAAPVELTLERDGARVDQGHIVVELGVPFTLAVKARDEYGNVVPTVVLSRTLQDVARHFNTPWQLLKLQSVQSDSVATYLRFKPLALGTTDLTLAVGLRTHVAVDIVRAGTKPALHP